MASISSISSKHRAARSLRDGRPAKGCRRGQCPQSVGTAVCPTGAWITTSSHRVVPCSFDSQSTRQKIHLAERMAVRHCASLLRISVTMRHEASGSSIRNVDERNAHGVRHRRLHRGRNSRSSRLRSNSATVTPRRKAATLIRPRNSAVMSTVSRAVNTSARAAGALAPWRRPAATMSPQRFASRATADGKASIAHRARLRTSAASRLISVAAWLRLLSS